MSKNFRWMITPLVVAGLALSMAGCRTAGIYDVRAEPVPALDNKPLSDNDVRNAIIEAGTELGWKMTPTGPGHIVGTLYIRSHKAVVDIPYTTKSYSITYKDSENLKYTGTTIHSNYNGWVKRLDQTISAKLMQKQ